jgi:hypothetical protein
MPREGDRNLTIPVELYEAMDEITTEKGTLYQSVLEFAKEAIRIRILEIRSQDLDWKMRKKRKS